MSHPQVPLLNILQIRLRPMYDVRVVRNSDDSTTIFATVLKMEEVELLTSETAMGMFPEAVA